MKKLPEKISSCKMCPYLRQIEREDDDRDDYDYYHCFLTKSVICETDIEKMHCRCPLEEY